MQHDAVSCAERSDVTLYVMHRRSENASVEPNCEGGKGAAAVARRRGSCLLASRGPTHRPARAAVRLVARARDEVRALRPVRRRVEVRRAAR